MLIFSRFLAGISYRFLMLRLKLGWVTAPFPSYSLSVSVFRFDLRLDFFNAVELFFVRFKRLRQDCGRSRMGCPQEALLERLVHPLVVLDHLQLALGQHVTARFLLLDFLGQQGLVILLLAHLTLQVVLLNPHSTRLALRGSCTTRLAAVEGLHVVAVWHNAASLYFSPTLLERHVPLFKLVLVVLLACFDTLPLHLLLLLLELCPRILLLGLLFLFFFDFLSF